VRLNIQIDRLVVDGIDLQRNQRPVMQAAFESELARLLARDGLNQELSSGVALPSLSAPAIEIPNGARPHTIGEQIAQAVYNGIGQ
jgi:hypothetical protein